MTDDAHLRLLRLLAERPDASQRQLAQALGISLGKTNYCVKALLRKGRVKVSNFKNSNNKIAYAYLLTPQGIEAKARMTVSFLKRKEAEYAALATEIVSLRAEVRQQREHDDAHGGEPNRPKR